MLQLHVRHHTVYSYSGTRSVGSMGPTAAPPQCQFLRLKDPALTLSWQQELLIGALLNRLTTPRLCDAEAHYLPMQHAFGPSMQVAFSVVFPATQLHVCRSKFVPGQPEGCCHLCFMSLCIGPQRFLPYSPTSLWL